RLRLISSHQEPAVWPPSVSQKNIRSDASVAASATNNNNSKNISTRLIPDHLRCLQTKPSAAAAPPPQLCSQRRRKGANSGNSSTSALQAYKRAKAATEVTYPGLVLLILGTVVGSFGNVLIILTILLKKETRGEVC
uniref:G_PROTEIN_RECEP_F1_2 domain-containing protein n=1 Tax=Macrostomum lignano TaxID=282301 RepID=A0A1I8FMX8_9PLAT